MNERRILAVAPSLSGAYFPAEYFASLKLSRALRLANHPSPESDQARALRGGGEMGALMRSFDWAATALGPVGTWPASLRTSVSILLSTRHPMFLWWGPELIQFYNDGYRQSLGPDRHPSALGQRGRECWAEIWPIIGHEVESIMAGGEATWHEDHLVPITRGDRVEDVYWSYSYSPVPDDTGGVGGVLVTVQETTQRILAERRKQTLVELADSQIGALTVEEIGSAASAALAANPLDVPFALIYLRGDGQEGYRLLGGTGTVAGSRAAPNEIALNVNEPWPVEEAANARALVLVRDVPARAGLIQRDLWPVPVREAVVQPLLIEGLPVVEGVLVAGANPQLRLDKNYQAFFAEVGILIAEALSKVRARELERRTEQQLRHVERLQSVTALAGGVAHEVNNQMTVVLGFGEFVLKALGARHPQAEDMRRVLLAGHRAAKVSQQLLTFTRQQVTQPRVLDLHKVTRDLEPVLRQLLGSDKELVLNPDRRASRISADPVQVEQVLINLVANARDATSTGGRVTITVEDVELTHKTAGAVGVAMAPGAYTLLTVADDGQGMDESVLARIFEPFFTTKPIGQGTGLGLSMVYGIVKRHEGFVWAQSSPGAGTTMRLYWPALSSAADQPPSVDRSDRPHRLDPVQELMVWVVEDEAPVRELVARTLAAEGLRVVTAEDGGQALRLLERTTVPPSAVICDLVMPRVNGRRVGNEVNAKYPDVPVLFMSGYTSDDVVRRGLMPENAAFLQKPFTPAELVQRVLAILVRPDVVSTP